MSVLDKPKEAGVVLIIIGLFWLGLATSDKLLRTPFVVLGGILFATGATMLFVAYKR